MARRATAEGWVQAFTVSECVTVLRLWLLALAAKDCGVVVSIQPLSQSQQAHQEPVNAGPESEEGAEGHAGCWNEGSSSKSKSSVGCGCHWEVLRLQTDQEAGLLRLTIQTPQHAQDPSQAQAQGQGHSYVRSFVEKVVVQADSITATSDTYSGTTDIASATTTATATVSATSSMTISRQQNNVTTTVRLFSYSVGLVDLGPKPLDKAATKDANEDEFCSVAGACITSEE